MSIFEALKRGRTIDVCDICHTKITEYIIISLTGPLNDDKIVPAEGGDNYYEDYPDCAIYGDISISVNIGASPTPSVRRVSVIERRVPWIMLLPDRGARVRQPNTGLHVGRLLPLQLLGAWDH